jgi:hypothetical protein
MYTVFVWNLPERPPRTPAEEDAYYAQFEPWPGVATISAVRRWLERIFSNRREGADCGRRVLQACYGSSSVSQ